MEKHMGMFSWECRGCGYSILGPYHLKKNTAWLNEAVLVSKSGKSYHGSYDGYGRLRPEDETVDVIEIDFRTEEPELWHKACWGVAGMPAYSGSSNSAADQGHFFEDKDYENVVNPAVSGVLPRKPK
jgi:hypothetical protein